MGRRGKGREGEGIGGKGKDGSRYFVRYLLKTLGDESERKIILKFILIFQDLKCSINKNTV
jgi:hypothetical protein